MNEGLEEQRIVKQIEMHIYVDADGCPVISIVEKIAKKHGIPVTLLSDSSHALSSDYSEVKVIDTGKDSVDFALVNLCQKGDIVVTQDYGVATMALGKGAYCIHQSGTWYTNENIDLMLLARYNSSKDRHSKKGKTHMRGPKKRTKEDDKSFAQSLEKMIEEIEGKEI